MNSLCVHPWQVFFDDSARNIAAGKAAGFHTVIVSPVTVCALWH
jgi:beta-phosphoglucomutase-like phosphatase (HAD superfamily)